jgi:programmed cell death protein 5
MDNFQLPAGFRPSAPPQGGQSSQSPEEQQAAREKAQAQEEMKRTMIAAMLEPAARERCKCYSILYKSLSGAYQIVSRISLTRPQLAQQVESLIVRMGQQGQVRGQVSDEALKGLLEQVRTILSTPYDLY